MFILSVDHLFSIEVDSKLAFERIKKEIGLQNKISHLII